VQRGLRQVRIGDGEGDMLGTWWVVGKVCVGGGGGCVKTSLMQRPCMSLQQSGSAVCVKVPFTFSSPGQPEERHVVAHSSTPSSHEASSREGWQAARPAMVLLQHAATAGVSACATPPAAARTAVTGEEWEEAGGVVSAVR